MPALIINAKIGINKKRKNVQRKSSISGLIKVLLLN